MNPHDDSEGPDLLAAEYVLGVLDDADRHAAEARLERDPAFAAEVAAWTGRLGPLAETAAPVSPPPELWARIDAALERPAATPRAANDDAPLRFWRGLALAASALAAASVAAVVVLVSRPEPTAFQVATLATPDGEAAVTLAFNPRTGALLVSPAAGLRPGEARPHLWLMEPGGGVQLVGAVEPGHAATHQLPEDLAALARTAEGAAVSLEPAGRERPLTPAGPVVASGKFSRL